MENARKKYPVVVVLSILMVGALIILGSYALWRISRGQTDTNDLLGACLDITFEPNSDRLLDPDAWPKSDAEGEAGEGYTFTVANTCDNVQTLNYDIVIESMAVSGKHMPDDYVRVKLDDNETKTFGLLPEVDRDEKATYKDDILVTRKIYTGTLNGKTPQTHTLRQWYSEDAPEETIGAKFSTKVKIVAGQGITNSNAAKFTEVALSKNVDIYDMWLNEQGNGFIIISNDTYYCGDERCNVYNVSMDGQVTEANLQYIPDTVYGENAIEYNYYEYIDKYDGGKLAKTSLKNPGFWIPNSDNGGAVTQNIQILDDTLTYDDVYCYSPARDIDLRDMTENRICLLKATDSNNNTLYGLVKEGPNPQVILEPSADYRPIYDRNNIMYSDRLYISDYMFKLAYRDGSIRTVQDSDYDFGQVVPIYDGTASARDVVAVGSAKLNDWSVLLGTYNNDKVTIYSISDLDGSVTLNDTAYPITLSNGNFFYAEPIEGEYEGMAKLYDRYGGLITSQTNVQNQVYKAPVLSYLKDGNVYFVDGEFESPDSSNWKVLYSMPNTNNKYDWLFQYIAQDSNNYYFLSGRTPGGESNNAIYILAK